MKKLIQGIESIKDLINHGDSLLNLTIQDLDLTKADVDWSNIKLANTAFLGCKMSKETEAILREKGAFIYPKFVGYPYNPYRKNLYTWQELMDGYDPENDQSVDFKIYTHFNNQRYSADINEALAQRIHDHAIDDALRTVIGMDDNGMTEKKCIGIMGGHEVSRNDESYKKVSLIAQNLAQEGYFILSGGGPGVMEAGNLGAYFAHYSTQELEDAIDMLSKAPDIEHHDYIDTACAVLKKYPDGAESLAIPTWFFGHEPSNVFATHIAKYFANSIREDILLGASLYGAIYAPGSAGTMQEVFADLAQNHYKTQGYISPMIFFDTDFWQNKSKLLPFIKHFATGKKYEKMILTSDNINEIISFIKNHPPVQ